MTGLSEEWPIFEQSIELVVHCFLGKITVRKSDDGDSVLNRKVTFSKLLEFFLLRDRNVEYLTGINLAIGDVPGTSPINQLVIELNELFFLSIVVESGNQDRIVNASHRR